MKPLICLLPFLVLASCAEPPPVASLEETLAAGATAICHRTGSGTGGREIEIVVAAPAVAAHLAHGDRAGSCEANPCGDLLDGTMFCEGTGFITCQGGDAVYRDCAPGTTCRPFEESILCDWPGAE